jgi:hypothetical protein
MRFLAEIEMGESPERNFGDDFWGNGHRDHLTVHPEIANRYPARSAPMRRSIETAFRWARELQRCRSRHAGSSECRCKEECERTSSTTLRTRARQPGIVQHWLTDADAISPELRSLRISRLACASVRTGTGRRWLRRPAVGCALRVRKHARRQALPPVQPTTSRPT